MNSLYVIWSFKHGQWWATDRQGYTPHYEQAGRYSAQDAGEIVTNSVLNESVQILQQVADQRGRPTVSGLWQE